MPEELPGIPISVVPATASPNSDLPSDPFASLLRIAVVDTVGPSPGAANRQETALEKRDETLRTAVNACIAALNAVDQYYLRRDGTTQQDSVAGVEGNMPMNGHILTGLGAGSNPNDSITYGQVTTLTNALSAAISAVSAALASYALITSVPFVTEYATAGTHTYTNTSGADQFVLLSACGAGGGGAADSSGGCGGGAGGAIVSMPVRLSPGDTIAFALTAGGAGGVSAPGVTGGATTVTITSANYPGGSMVLTLTGGTGGSNTPGTGGTVTWTGFNSTSNVTLPFPLGVTGGSGETSTGATHAWASGGASALAFNYGGSDAPTTGALGSGGAGGDAGSAGGGGYGCVLVSPRA